jgi:hypothetical protein
VPERADADERGNPDRRAWRNLMPGKPAGKSALGEENKEKRRACMDASPPFYEKAAET